MSPVVRWAARAAAGILNGDGNRRECRAGHASASDDRVDLGDLGGEAHGGGGVAEARYSERLADNNIVASVGSKGDPYDNALVESFNGLYKWELIYPKGPWTGLSEVEFATLTYVDWFNHRRLHGEITPGPGYTTPAAFEAEYRQIISTTPVETQSPE